MADFPFSSMNLRQSEKLVGLVSRSLCLRRLAGSDDATGRAPLQQKNENNRDFSVA
jgi:hypothetical protein